MKNILKRFLMLFVMIIQPIIWLAFWNLLTLIPIFQGNGVEGFMLIICGIGCFSFIVVVIYYWVEEFRV